ncbi:MAG: PAS domain S-box protein [Actinomycetota bacterium]|nr:PAS domain S-box protein [Actinomycetota bacterium]
MDPSDHDQNEISSGAASGDGGAWHAIGTVGQDDRWLRSVVEHSSEMVIIVHPNGTLRYANPAWERALGHDPDEAVGTMNVLDHVHPDDLPRVLEEAEEALAEGGVATNEAEYRFRHADGSWRWVESVVTYLLDDPAVGGVVVTSRDVTERKEAEERLRYQAQLLDTVGEAVIALDVDGRVSYWNRAAEVLYGWSSEEAMGRKLRGMVVPNDLRGRAEEIARQLREGKNWAGEFEVRRRDGTLLPVEGTDTPVFGEDGDLIGYIGVLRDVTERKEAEEAVRRSEERLRSLADAAFEGILISDRGEILEANRALIDMFGYSLSEVIGRSTLEFVAPEHRDLVRQKIASGDEEPYEVTGVRKDGTRIDLEVRGRAFSYRGRNVRVTAVRDVTERKRAEDRLRKTEERYRTLVERLPAVTFVDRADRAEGLEESLYVSPQVEGMFGYTPEEWMAGRLWRERLHPDDRERVLASDERFEADGGPVDHEYRLLAKDGSVVWVHEETVLVRDEAGEPRFVQGIMSDVTQKKRSEERLHHLAFHDPLTGLPNRRLFVDHLGHALERTRRRGNRVAVLFMDLDGFKVVNDSLGHDVGDLLLTVVAQRLGRCLRPEDALARFGGDEFVVLLEDVDDPSEAVRVAERITQELRRPCVLEERQLYAAASIGVSLGHAGTHSPEGLLREADTAMYRAKEDGCSYCVFDPAMHDRAVNRLEIENDLRRGIERNEFVVHYQPIVNLETGAVWGVEALVRWEHPERGLLNPDEFVSVAEESGLVVPMGELVLEEACRRAVEWQREFPLTPPLAISVNLSGRQLRRPDLPEIVGQALAKSGLPASSLGLDITETVYISALNANTVALDRLRALGIRISLDDFGSGYSSLSYLKQLPMDILKIDKSFTKGLGLEVEDTAIVQTVVDLAHILGMEVVAEGVEIEEQQTLLEEMGCDFAQGYHFSRPLPPEAASEFLNSAYRGVAHRGDLDSFSDSS